tara:strand:+ start:60 stop:1514 length:1455 start_codon:yes stop_codon:yes gene_type:complete
MPPPNTPNAPVLPRIVVLGGTGRIGTAVAAHLHTRAEPAVIQLAGRDRAKGEAALAEVRKERTGHFSQSRFEFLQLDWRDPKALRDAFEGDGDRALPQGPVIAVIHTAGPYAGETPDVLRAAIAASVPVYVDLSDPVPYLREAKTLAASAQASGTLALCAGGAFPGLSNVLAMECAARLGSRVRDLDFSYFTAGLGGSGAVNLYITNDGFGEEVPVFRDGELSPQLDAGAGLRKVEFFLPGRGEASQELVGERAVWNWPFPEGCTVAERLAISGSSSVGMGTAPDLWNDVMGLMVKLVPRGWWKERAFSQGLADFSRPLVTVTDLFTGETHAIRVDATAEDGSRVTAVQAHTSFRRCVGQSCAEFTLAMLEAKGAHRVAERGGGVGDPRAPEAPRQAEELRATLAQAGVFLPEDLFADAAARAPMLERLLATPGTLNAGFEQCLSEEAQCVVEAVAATGAKAQGGVDDDAPAGFADLMPGLDGD